MKLTFPVRHSAALELPNGKLKYCNITTTLSLSLLASPRLGEGDPSLLELIELSSADPVEVEEDEAEGQE